jgi:urea transport system ATP-binding protein
MCSRASIADQSRAQAGWLDIDSSVADGAPASEETIMLIGHQPKEFLLAVEALTVSFDGFKAVNDLSFYVEENEIRVIIGPNGAGKTTVLDLICGKTKATSGSIQFRDKELTKMKENQIVQAGVGRKFQTPSIYDDLTVFENLEISFPRGRTVFGALTFTATPRCATACMKSPR